MPGMEAFVLAVIVELEVPSEGVGVSAMVVALFDIVVNVSVAEGGVGEFVGDKKVGVTVETEAEMVSVFPVADELVALDVDEDVEVDEELTAPVSSASSG